MVTNSSSITSNLSDLLSAIKIFRDSRNAFYDLYPADNTSTPTSSKAIDHVSNELKNIIKNIDLEFSNLKINCFILINYPFFDKLSHIF